MRSITLAFLAAAGVALSGCSTGMHTSPDIETATGNVVDPNLFSQTQATIRSIEWVVNKYPIELPRSITRNDTEAGGKPSSSGVIAINLVPGTTSETYDKVCRELSKRLGVDAVPITDEIARSNSVPIYHVGRAWIRTQYARVDVFRPMLDLPRRQDGAPVYQCVTVNLKGWLGPWKIDGTQTREPGTIDVPAVHAYGTPTAASRRLSIYDTY